MDPEAIEYNTNIATLLERSHKLTTAVDELLLWDDVLDVNEETLDIIDALCDDIDQGCNRVDDEIGKLRSSNTVLDSSSGARSGRDPETVRMWNQVGEEFKEVFEIHVQRLLSLDPAASNEEFARAVLELATKRAMEEQENKSSETASKSENSNDAKSKETAKPPTAPTASSSHEKKNESPAKPASSFGQSSSSSGLGGGAKPSGPGFGATGTAKTFQSSTGSGFGATKSAPTEGPNKAFGFGQKKP